MMSYCVNTVSSKTEQFPALISCCWGTEAVKDGRFSLVDCYWSGFVCVPHLCVCVFLEVDNIDGAGLMSSEQGAG